MAQTNLNFATQIEDWVRRTEQRMTAVFRESTQETVEIMQRVGPSKRNPQGAGGAMPVDFGFLRASLVVSLTGLPPMTRAPSEGRSYSYNEGGATLAIAGAEIGDTIYAGYSANYAAFVEYGTSNTPPRGFVRFAASQWVATVNRVTERAKERAGR